MFELPGFYLRELVLFRMSELQGRMREVTGLGFRLPVFQGFLRFRVPGWIQNQGH